MDAANLRKVYNFISVHFHVYKSELCVVRKELIFIPNVQAGWCLQQDRGHVDIVESRLTGCTPEELL